MFWKKKKTKASKILFEYHEADSRHAYREVPLKKWPAFIIYEGREISILTISAKGLSFQSDCFEKDNTYSVNIKITKFLKATQIKIHILSKKKNYIRCEFVDCPDKIIEKIHFYVLNVQKQRSQRKDPANFDGSITTTQLDISQFKDMDEE